MHGWLRARTWGFGQKQVVLGWRDVSLHGGRITRGSSECSIFLERRGIAASHREPLQCQDGRERRRGGGEGEKNTRSVSQCLFRSPPPPPAKCGTVVLSVITTSGSILLGDVAAPPAPGERKRGEQVCV